MQGIEAVVVGQGDVRRVIQQQGQDVVSLLADGVVQSRVSVRVLWVRPCVTFVEWGIECNVTVSRTVLSHVHANGFP